MTLTDAQRRALRALRPEAFNAAMQALRFHAKRHDSRLAMCKARARYGSLDRELKREVELNRRYWARIATDRELYASAHPCRGGGCEWDRMDPNVAADLARRVEKAEARDVAADLARRLLAAMREGHDDAQRT